MRISLIFFGAVALLVGIVVAGALTVPQLRWRFEVLRLVAAGEIEDLELGEVVPMLLPGSGFWLESLPETRNPNSAIRNPYNSDEDVQAGADLFRQQCAACHGTDAAGGEIGPPLNTGELRHGNSDWWIYRVVNRGIPGTQMVGRELEKLEAWRLVAFIRSREQASVVVDMETLVGPTIETRPVDAGRLLNARSEPDQWLTYSGAYDGKRYSLLDQINRSNASQLQVKWLFQTDVGNGFFEATPIVNDGVLYFTAPPDRVHAVDAASGEPIWTYERIAPSSVPVCCGKVNRGAAILGNRLFVTTVDAHLLALDARTGELLWDTTVADHTQGFTMTVAPLVVGDRVIAGISGGEYGIRGFLDAYDAETGERLWRFNTIPGEGEPGHETWPGDSWKTGGGPTWTTGSYDPDLGLLYWGVGNPSPDYQGEFRVGDNLYTDSVIALEIESGELVWHFQFTPHDVGDRDATQVPVLVDADWRGQPRKLMYWGNRNGFFYVLDRATGEFLLAEPFVKVTWAHGIDENGRPIVNPDAAPTPQGTVSWPGPNGGTNWHSPSYSPHTELFYLSFLEMGRVVFREHDQIDYTPGNSFWGSVHQMIPSERHFYTGVRAIDPTTGKIEWEKRNPTRLVWSRTGGVLSTAGDVVFGSDLGSIFAVDATTGEELWSMNAGGYVNGNATTYAVDGRQLVTVPVGRTYITLGLPD